MKYAYALYERLMVYIGGGFAMGLHRQALLQYRPATTEAALRSVLVEVGPGGFRRSGQPEGHRHPRRGVAPCLSLQLLMVLFRKQGEGLFSTCCSSFTEAQHRLQTRVNAQSLLVEGGNQVTALVRSFPKKGRTGLALGFP